MARDFNHRVADLQGRALVLAYPLDAPTVAMLYNLYK